jgi:transcriptional regulator with XRE-family HTH domain
MDLFNSPKHIRALGRQLKEARESQGHNLAILAGQCNLSVVQLTAIERSLDGIEALNKSLDGDVYIPEFLRKK